MDKKIRKIILLVAILNLLYFGIEFFYALKISSVSLVADSIDFLEDSSLNFLIFFATTWSLLWRRRIGIFLASSMAVPALVTFWAVWRQLALQTPPHGLTMSWVSFGALIINVFCSLILITYQKNKDNLIRATYLSSRNDAITNVVVIATGVVTTYYPSIWPDLIVGVFIALLHGAGAFEVYQKSIKM